MSEHPETASVLVLRDIAQAMAAVRTSLEHGDRTGAVHAAQHLLRAVERLPDSREEYERLCAEADRLGLRRKSAGVPLKKNRFSPRRQVRKEELNIFLE